MKFFIWQAKKFLVRNQVARPDAKNRPPARQVIEKRHALRDFERMMKWQAEHRRSKANPMRAGRCFRENHLGRGHRLPAAGVMLADEKLVVAELIRVMNQRNVKIGRASCRE